VLKRVIFLCSSSHYYPPPVAPSYGGVGGIGGIGGGIGGGGFRGGYGYHGYYGYSDGGYGGYPTTYYGYIPYGMIIQSVQEKHALFYSFLSDKKYKFLL
jgi:hypothetical protein